MQIKKFVGATLKETVAQMKKELGKEAMVLQSKSVPRNGIFDFGGKGQVEILAAVDHDAATLPAGSTHSTDNGIRQKTESRYTSVMPPVVPPSPEARVSPHDLEILKSEMKEIRATIGKVADFLRYRNLPALPENLLVVLKQLIDNEVEEKLAKTIIQEVHISLKGDEYEDLRLIVNLTIEKIAGFIKSSKPGTRTAGRGAEVVVLVGPTGVGKTTTLAKLASNAKLIEEQKVALISADTYRIGAVEQLRTFAGIADIPLQVVYTAEEMEESVMRFKHLDKIFIDTTGRGQRDKSHLRDTAMLVAAAQPDEVHLVASATTKFKDMQDILNNFRCMGFNRMLFTKLDETTSLGVILNILATDKKPVSYITMGQTVPDDIEAVQVNRLARMILRRKNCE